MGYIACQSLHLSKCHIVGNHTSLLICILTDKQKKFSDICQRKEAFTHVVVHPSLAYHTVFIEKHLTESSNTLIEKK